MDITLWGATALKYTDEMIKSKDHANIVIVLTCCRVRSFEGVTHLTTSSTTQFFMDLPIPEAQPFYQRPVHPVIFSSVNPEPDELAITCVSDIYMCLSDGVDKGKVIVIDGTIVDVDLYNDWKYVQCTRCFRKAYPRSFHYFCETCQQNVMNPRQVYKLVIQVVDKGEEISCVFFDSHAIKLVGLTTTQLLSMSMQQGGGDPDWIYNFFFDNFYGQRVILAIRIDEHNLPPKCVRRFTVTKYYGDSLEYMKNNEGIPKSPTRVSTIGSDCPINAHNNDIDGEEMLSDTFEYMQKLMDEIEWGPSIMPQTDTISIDLNKRCSEASTSVVEGNTEKIRKVENVVDGDGSELGVTMKDTNAHTIPINPIEGYIASSTNMDVEILKDANETVVECDGNGRETEATLDHMETDEHHDEAERA